MARKGNLLYNGDFETGTLEGWVNGICGLQDGMVLEVKSEAKYRGNYGGKLYSGTTYRASYVGYNKTCSFEEYEAYLYIIYGYLDEGFTLSPQIYGLDDKGNLIDKYYLAYNTEKDVWRCFKAIIRGFGEITHFKVGVLGWCQDTIGRMYFDEAKLIPLRSVRGHELAEYRMFSSLGADKEWFSGLACIGKCKLRSIIRTANVSGTSPTLDVNLEISLLDNSETKYTLSHSQFTGEGFEEVTIDLPEASVIKVTYDVGGSYPSFDVYHHLRIEPY